VVATISGPHYREKFFLEEGKGERRGERKRIRRRGERGKR
jgi:hypothetical protein